MNVVAGRAGIIGHLRKQPVRNFLRMMNLSSVFSRLLQLGTAVALDRGVAVRRGERACAGMEG
jgi:hypothetical protein